jgi:long-chain acyl-CoA synthetase
MLVNDFLENSAERFADKIALICDGQRLTYAQIEEQANQVANALLALGVQRGDRVAIWLPNSVETVIAIFAILKASAIFTVINPTTKPGKLAYVLNNCAASGIFAPARQGEQMAQLFDAVPSLDFTIMCGKEAARRLLTRTRRFSLTCWNPIPPRDLIAPPSTWTWPASSTPPAAPVSRRAQCPPTPT